jgi:hypothetical protein
MKTSKIITGLILSLSLAAYADPIVTESTSTSVSTTNGDTTTTVKSPPPSAISPAVTVINSDVCVVGYSGAAQTQILGLSFGGTSKDENCERIKLGRSLYDMGMKVAAVAVMCQDARKYTDDTIRDVNRDMVRNQKEISAELKALRTDMDDKIRKALDNPLSK